MRTWMSVLAALALVVGMPFSGFADTAQKSPTDTGVPGAGGRARSGEGRGNRAEGPGQSQGPGRMGGMGQMMMVQASDAFSIVYGSGETKTTRFFTVEKAEGDAMKLVETDKAGGAAVASSGSQEVTAWALGRLGLVPPSSDDAAAPGAAAPSAERPSGERRAAPARFQLTGPDGKAYTFSPRAFMRDASTPGEAAKGPNGEQLIEIKRWKKSEAGYEAVEMPARNWDRERRNATEAGQKATDAAKDADKEVKAKTEAVKEAGKDAKKEIKSMVPKVVVPTEAKKSE